MSKWAPLPRFMQRHIEIKEAGYREAGYKRAAGLLLSGEVTTTGLRATLYGEPSNAFDEGAMNAVRDWERQFGAS